MIFVSYLRTHCKIQSHKGFTLVCMCKFFSFGLYFYDLVWDTLCEKRSNITLLHEDIQLYQYPCGRDNPFFPIQNSLCIGHCRTMANEIPVENQLITYAWDYLWTLSLIPLICMSILMSVHPCFDYFSFVVSLEIRKCEPSNFGLLF